jgi:hypothetical protein
MVTVGASGVNGGVPALDFTSFSTEDGWDFMRLYDGAAGDASAPLLGTYSGSGTRDGLWDQTPVVGRSGAVLLPVGHWQAGGGRVSAWSATGGNL